MAALWALAVRIGDASHVDVAWALLIAGCALLYAALADGSAAHRVLAAALASIWGFRLGLYLLFDRVLGKDEDGRYRALRERWGERANWRFFWFFQLQAAGVVLFSLPCALIALDGGEVGVLRVEGRARVALGNAGVVVADAATRALAPRPGEPRTDDALGPLGVVEASELLLRGRDLVRSRARRDRGAVGLDRVDRPGRAPVPPLPRHRHPCHRGAGASHPRRLRRRTSGRRASSSRCRGSLCRRGLPRPYENCQPSPAANDFRIRRATTMRCTSSGPS